MVIAMLRMKFMGWYLFFVINIGFSFAQVDIESPTRDTLTFTFINQDFNVLLHSTSNSSEEVWIKFNPTLIFKDEATRDEIIKKAALLYVAILRTAQQLNQQDLEGQNGKTNLAKAIVKDVNAILEYGDVSAVTFSQFLVYKKPVVKSHEF